MPERAYYAREARRDDEFESVCCVDPRLLGSHVTYNVTYLHIYIGWYIMCSFFPLSVPVFPSPPPRHPLPWHCLFCSSSSRSRKRRPFWPDCGGATRSIHSTPKTCGQRLICDPFARWHLTCTDRRVSSARCACICRPGRPRRLAVSCRCSILSIARWLVGCCRRHALAGACQSLRCTSAESTDGSNRSVDNDRFAYHSASWPC